MFQHMLQKILADLYHCIFRNTILDLANSNEFTRLQLYEIMNASGQTNYTDKLSFLSEYVRNLVKPLKLFPTLCYQLANSQKKLKKLGTRISKSIESAIREKWIELRATKIF